MTATTRGTPTSADIKPYLAASAAALVAVAVLAWTGDDAFERFFGPVPPAMVVVISTLVGAGSLQVCARHGWPRLGRTTSASGDRYRPIGAAIVLAAIAVAVDVALRFPEDMNTPWPESVLFYLAIAFVAETVFHLVPLALVLAARGRINRWGNGVWPVVFAVGSLEAIFQVIAALSESEVGIVVFVAIHLFAIGVFELVTFHRSGFTPMLTFRLCYYSLWHILWGHARLSLLF